MNVRSSLQCGGEWNSRTLAQTERRPPNGHHRWDAVSAEGQGAVATVTRFV